MNKYACIFSLLILTPLKALTEMPSPPPIPSEPNSKQSIAKPVKSFALPIEPKLHSQPLDQSLMPPLDPSIPSEVQFQGIVYTRLDSSNLDKILEAGATTGSPNDPDYTRATFAADGEYLFNDVGERSGRYTTINDRLCIQLRKSAPFTCKVLYQSNDGSLVQLQAPKGEGGQRIHRYFLNAHKN